MAGGFKTLVGELRSWMLAQYGQKMGEKNLKNPEFPEVGGSWNILFHLHMGSIHQDFCLQMTEIHSNRLNPKGNGLLPTLEKQG